MFPKVKTVVQMVRKYLFMGRIENQKAPHQCFGIRDDLSVVSRMDRKRQRARNLPAQKQTKNRHWRKVERGRIPSILHSQTEYRVYVLATWAAGQRAVAQERLFLCNKLHLCMK